MEAFIDRFRVAWEIVANANVGIHWLLVVSENAMPSSATSATPIANIDDKLNGFIEPTAGAYRYFNLSRPRAPTVVGDSPDLEFKGVINYTRPKSPIFKEIFKSNDNYVTLVVLFDKHDTTDESLQMRCVGELYAHTEENKRFLIQ
jgi:hypothetical protein